MASQQKPAASHDVGNGDTTDSDAPTRLSDETNSSYEVTSVPLAAAIRKQKPTLWTNNMLQLYLCLAIAACTSCANGYNGPVMGNINGYKQYREYFNFDPENGTPYNGLPFAIGPIGNAVGSFFVGPVHDSLGRKWGILLGSVIIFVFAAVQAASQNLTQFLIARFALGFGGALSVVGGAIFTTEMSPPHLRGALTGLFNCYYYIGNITSSWVSYGSQHIVSDRSWRLPLYLQMIFAGLAAIGAIFLPESPRWLVANNRHEEAIDTMVSLQSWGFL